MTDPETADRTYVCPMIPELLESIIAKVIHSFSRSIAAGGAQLWLLYVLVV